MLHDPALQPQFWQRFGVKELLIPARNLCAGGQTIRGYIEGVGGGVGKPEAAGVCGDTNVDGLGHTLVRLYLHIQQQLPNNLGTGCAVGLHQLPGSILPAGAVMVDPQIDAVFKAIVGPGQHIVRRHIHGDENIPLLRLGLGKALHQRGKQGRNIGIFENMGSLSHAPQTQTKTHGRANGVAVGLAVGQNDEIIPLQQPVGAIKSRQFRHFDLPPGS